MPLRTTIVIAPLGPSRKIVARANPLGAALRGIGIGAALLVLGLFYLLVAPFFWCARKLRARRIR